MSTVPTITSAARSQAVTPSLSSGQTLIAHFHNKPAKIAIFTCVGIFALVVIFTLAVVALRRKRRGDPIESAIYFTPWTPEHLINDDDHRRGDGSSGSGGGLISRSDGNSCSDVQDIRPRVPSVTLGASPSVSVPALAPTPIPVSVPASIHAPKETQRRGPGAGYIVDRRLDREVTLGARSAYGNSAQPFYDTVLQKQPPPSPSPSPPPYHLERQPRPLRWQKRERWPLPSDLPTGIGPIPSSLLPSFQPNNVVFNVPFAPTVTKPWLSIAVDSDSDSDLEERIEREESRTSKLERRRTQQVPLPPPAARFLRKLPDTLEGDDEDVMTRWYYL